MRIRTLHRSALLLPLLIAAFSLQGKGQFTCDYGKQGSAMKLTSSNRGDFGRISYQPCNLTDPTGGLSWDSLGLEYPVGAKIEHIHGGGLWVGGLLDTARVGTAPPITLVSTSYEGGSGPLFEFFPGNSMADTIWKGGLSRPDPPPGWDEYWQGALPYNPRSDQDFYCTFTDTVLRPMWHVPMFLKVIRSSFSWDSVPAVVIEYLIMNNGYKTIDSVYVGFFLDADVGWVSVPSFWWSNFSGYDEQLHLGYTHHPFYPAPTPVGLQLIDAPRPLDSLRIGCRYGFIGNGDGARYAVMSSGVVSPPEYPNYYDTRFLISAGPLVLRPSNGPNPDTLKFTVAIVAARNVVELKENAQTAAEHYRRRTNTGR